MNILEFILVNFIHRSMKDYFHHSDHLIDKYYKYNKILLVGILKDVPEYISDHRSRTRIILAIISQIILAVVSIKSLLCALIREVSYQV